MENKCSSLAQQIDNLSSELNSVKVERDELSQRIQIKNASASSNVVSNSMSDVPNPVSTVFQIVSTWIEWVMLDQRYQIPSIVQRLT